MGDAILVPPPPRQQLALSRFKAVTIPAGVEVAPPGFPCVSLLADAAEHLPSQVLIGYLLVFSGGSAQVFCVFF